VSFVAIILCVASQRVFVVVVVVVAAAAAAAACFVMDSVQKLLGTLSMCLSNSLSPLFLY
jgi:hypothetical protein